MNTYVVLLKDRKQPVIQYADRYERTTVDGSETCQFFTDDVEVAFYKDVRGVRLEQRPTDEPQEPNDGEGGPKGPGPNRQRVQRMQRV